MGSSHRSFTESEALRFITSSEIMFGNAAGVSRDLNQLLAFVQAGANVATFGTIRPHQHSGNPGMNFWFDERTGNGINALGVPDAGITTHLPVLKLLCHAFSMGNAQLIVSVMGDDAFDPGAYEYMARQLLLNGAAHITEGNFACPNMVVGGKRMPIVSYHMESLRLGVRALRKGAGDMPIGVKISPITEASMLGEIDDICRESHVEFLISANTIPNCHLQKEDGTDAIDMKLGGLSGAALRPLVRGMSAILMPLLKKHTTKLILAGGVGCGEDAYGHLCTGVHGVMFNTALYRRGGDPKVISEIAMGDEGLKQPGLIELIATRGLPGMA